ncbi:shiftless antiviral inhibitor of ribosomal frameshifting protein isoform X1 [Varanus komodoensis]|uniref:shiftless antiviral inhibitor of ribosomal frameshifting protein isoform X1 n=1 Tax=Varanus komodoensis TaxID=61221 RepID=UPI001CF7E5D7|nr:shiftless antiviral inhibitor of ribosomal frameshifting protein isoform X1 [Varanus komodoensis]XP_044299474.1 shiftless antiviral inhibitor of ribosomal frameshifting protein isoform X1 [Varanus komodoensis]XP_044299475.1 shiftless antiviral inhibitor of ribosomal frameshifting protein isoform X1 [Varanus komodoensis]
MQRVTQEEVQLEKSVRRLREKFYGKVSILDAVILMRRFANNHDLVCKFIILCKDELEDMDTSAEGSLDSDPVALKVLNKLKLEELKKKKPDAKNDDKIMEVAQQLKVLPLTEENLCMFTNAQNNRIPPVDHQFSCQGCDRMWWRRVPERKQVSRCPWCKVRYDPVPFNKMWGIAEFSCTACGRTFRGSGQMGTPSPCYSCHTPVYPSCIIPPRKTPGPRGRQQHSCFAEDCYNRREPHIPGTHCVHPRSRAKNGLPKVICPSQVHDSTGSTVATCLSQGSLACWDVDELILEDLKEEDEEEDGRSSN